MTPRTGTTPAGLGWNRNRVNATPKPCRICTQPAFMTDADGRPCHKVCGEAETETQIGRQVEHYGRGGRR